MPTETKTPGTTAKMLATILFDIIVLLMTDVIRTFTIGYLATLLPQVISLDMLTSYCLDILFWCSVTTYSSYMKSYYIKLIKFFESVGANFAVRECTYESLALGEEEMSEIGGFPISLILTESGPSLGTSPRNTDGSSLAKTPAATIRPPMEPCAPGPSMKEAQTSSRERPPSSPSTLSEEARVKHYSSKPKERLPRGKSSQDENATDRDLLYAKTPPAPAPKFGRPLRWHLGGKYIDGTPVPPRHKQNKYTAEPPITSEKVTAPSQGGTEATTPENSEERSKRKELDISDLLSPECNTSLMSTPSQGAPSEHAALRKNDPPLQAESLAPPPSQSPPPTPRWPPHKCPEQLVSSQNRSVSSPDSASNDNKGTSPQDEDTAMREVPPLNSSYISNAMGSWGTTREPINKEGVVVAVSISWSNDRKASFCDRGDLDGVSEEDILRITNSWAAGLLEVCERKLGLVAL